jgi:hypothetical protein
MKRLRIVIDGDLDVFIKHFIEAFCRDTIPEGAGLPARRLRQGSGGKDNRD